MEIFKTSRGDLVGIIIPGSFFVLNVILLFNDILKGLIGIDFNITLSQNQDILSSILLIVVFCYIFGFIFRLWPILDVSTKKDSYKFPYFDWFIFEFIKKKLPEGIMGRWINLLNLDSNEQTMKQQVARINDRQFLNYCKNIVFSKSQEYSNEILYSEGKTRFISGMFYSLLLSVVMMACKLIVTVNPFLIIIGCLYLAVAIMFLFNLKRIRKAETAQIFIGYALFYIHDENENKKPINN